MKLATHNPICLMFPVTDSTVRASLMRCASFQGEARKMGGQCRVFRAANSIQIEVNGISQSHVDSILSLILSVESEGTVDFQIARSIRSTELPKTVISGEYLREKLTKKLLFSLPQGAWLVSNVGFNPWTAHLMEQTDRQRLWEQAAERGAAQRLVSVVWSEQDAKQFSEAGVFYFTTLDLKDGRT
jgi:hypothetical protein